MKHCRQSICAAGFFGKPLYLLAVAAMAAATLLLVAGAEPSIGAAGSAAQPPSSVPYALARSGVRTSYPRTRMQFEVNRGQGAAGIDYLARRPGYLFTLTSTAATLTLQKLPEQGGPENAPRKPLALSHARHRFFPAAHSKPAPVTMRLSLIGANPRAAVTGTDELPGRINYASGARAARLHTNIAAFAGVKYKGVYPGIDLIYHGNDQGRLEYDFHVAPGADSTSIRLGLEGVDAVSVDAYGDLVLHTAAGEIRQPRPFIYQEVDGAPRRVAGGYVLAGAREVGFHVCRFDASRPLIIDPAIVYSSFVGGLGNPSNGDKDSANDITVDSAGNIYVIGETNSLGRYDTDIYVRKFDPSGSKLLYATYLDSNQTNDFGNAIAVDSAGNAYLTGQFGDGELMSGLGVLVAKLSPAGVPLYEYYFGANSPGFSADEGTGIAVDDSGNVYVVGITGGLGTPFPTTRGVIQETFAGGLSDAFVVKMDQHGNFIYSTLLGGTGTDEGRGIAIRKVGGVYNAYVTGKTALTGDFRTTKGALQEKFGGASDVFVAELNDTGTNFVYSTFIGGDGLDEGHAIAVDAQGNAYLTGLTEEEPSSGGTFPVVNAFQPIYGGDGGGTPAEANAFVAKLNPTGTKLIYSSYMGGAGYGHSDEGNSITVDAGGYAYLTGTTDTSPDLFTTARFPIVDAFQPHPGGGDSTLFPDAFVAKLTPAGALVFSSYLGGNNWDEGNAIALGVTGTAFAYTIYLTGTTQSVDFPATPDAFQPKLAGGGCGQPYSCPDTFVTKVSDVVSAPTATPTPRPTPTATHKPTPTATRKPTPTATRKPTPTATRKPTPTATRKPTPTATRKPTNSPTPKPTLQ